ncbi:MAG: amidase [Planctomycetota bacterium]
MTSQASRRAFLAAGGSIAAWAVTGAQAQDDAPATIDDLQNASLDAAPEAMSGGLTPRTIEEAEKLAGVRYTADERRQILATIENDIEWFIKRRAVRLPNELAPAQTFDPRLPDVKYELNEAPSTFNIPERVALPVEEADIAFAPVTTLASWIRNRRITSRELTRLYISRLKQINPALKCVVSLLEESAMAQATAADDAMVRGEYRGPLHGIPWGAKDLFDTVAGRTTWGATPYKDRQATSDAAVVQRLAEAGAVLTSKLTLGALAYGDIWFNGRTNNPFNPAQGSSGSSAGSAAATAAGLVSFSLGTETLGSIVSPCMRCGTTGLRPTFGRVSRTGAMTLCWSLDKVGPIARTVEDCALILDAICGADTGDPSSTDMPFSFDTNRDPRELVVGYNPAWFDQGSDLDRATLDAARARGMQLREVNLPDWPYDGLLPILMVEAASAFEDLTLSDEDDELVWQDDAAWPNLFRAARFTSAIEYVQANRFRRMVMRMMHDVMADVDVILAPSFAAGLLLITNNTGHPSLTLRTGFSDNGSPSGITLIGKLYDEGTLCNAGIALEQELDVWHRRPELG